VLVRVLKKGRCNLSEKKTRSLDLKGEVCPYTFVKSKLMMEQLNLGEVLEVIVDHGPAAKNIPKSMEMEGQEVLEVKELNTSEWKIVLRKNSP
jgi:TusA-related sulfurtransferase